jgi:hypothetical protein
MTAPRTVATLARFDRVFPGESMPADLKSLSFAAQMALKDRDPGLYRVLAGQMDAATEAAVLGGSWPDVAPPPPSAAEIREREVAQLLSQGPNPYLPGGSLTARLQLEALDPAAAIKQRALAQPYVALEEANRATAERQRQQALVEGGIAFQNATAAAAARQRIAQGVL